jgi:hypothetical protein
MKISLLQWQGFFAEDYFYSISFCGDSNITKEEICLQMDDNKFKHSLKTELKPSEQELIKNDGLSIKALSAPSEQELVNYQSSLSKALIVREEANFLLSYEYLFRDEIAAKTKLEALYDELVNQFNADDIFKQMLETGAPEDSTVVVSGASEHHATHGYSSHCFIG